MALIATVSAMAAVEHSALAEATAATAHLSSVSVGSSSGVTGIGALLGSLKSIVTAIVKGGCIMGMKAKVTAAVAAVALVSGGAYYYTHQTPGSNQEARPVEISGPVDASFLPKVIPLGDVYTLKDVPFAMGGYKDAQLVLGAQNFEIKKARPTAITKEPETVSQQPLYGIMDRGSYGASWDRQFIFRLDEPEGNNTGHSQLIMDLNGNGDLTDDPVFQELPGLTEREWNPRGPRLRNESVVFGPIEIPTENPGGLWHPAIRLQANLSYRGNTGEFITGLLCCEALSYLETSVDLGGVKEKIWIADANFNMRLGDTHKLGVRRGPDGDSWEFSGGDMIVHVREGSREAGPLGISR
jgi:hypothetical protein